MDNFKAWLIFVSVLFIGLFIGIAHKEHVDAQIKIECVKAGKTLIKGDCK